MIAVLDAHHILEHAKLSHLAYEVDVEAGERETQVAERNVLLTLVILDLAPMILQAAQARGATIVLDRRREAVLWAAEEADLTAAVLRLYDALYDKEVARLGLPAIKAAIHARLDTLRRLTPEERQELRTGQYL